MNSERLLKLHFHKKEAVTWLGVEHFFSYESRLASMENRNPGRLMLSSEADLWNFSWSAFSSSSLCFLFFLLFLRSLALLELSLDPPEELSSDKPPSRCTPHSLLLLPPQPANQSQHKLHCQGQPGVDLVQACIPKADKRRINCEQWRRDDHFMWSD